MRMFIGLGYIYALAVKGLFDTIDGTDLRKMDKMAKDGANRAERMRRRDKRWERAKNK